MELPTDRRIVLIFAALYDRTEGGEAKLKSAGN